VGWRRAGGASITLSQLSFGNSPLIVLSLDTTTRAGSAALVDNGRVRAELVGDATLTHGQRLPADLMRVLEDAGVSVDDLDLLAVAAGPGSFTGLRVGIAAMQGLAFAADLQIVPVSALDALARAGADGERPVAAWMDAQRGQVYAALYSARGEVLIEASSLAPEETLDRWSRQGLPDVVRFMGDGAIRYAETIQQRLGRAASVASAVPPLAGIIGRIAHEHPDRGVAPHAVVPIYVRRPDAELARLRRPAVE
jgi:tRNA threonylcarbamoyladenosine biosynthesis protein TsaB